LGSCGLYNQKELTDNFYLLIRASPVSKKQSKSMLRVLMKFPSLHGNLVLELLPFVRYFDHDTQDQIVARIPIMNPQLISTYFMPPWKTFIDGEVIAGKIQAGITSADAQHCLEEIFSPSNRSKLEEACMMVSRLSKLILTLGRHEKEGPMVGYAKILLELAGKGLTGAFESFVALKPILPPRTMEDLVISAWPKLVMHPVYESGVASFCTSPELGHRVLTKPTVEGLVRSGWARTLSRLARNGPHEVIDEAIIQNGRGSLLGKKSEKILRDLAFARVQIEREKQEYGEEIKIPSIFLFISDPKLHTLPDRYFAGSKLLHRAKGPTIEILGAFGVQYLPLPWAIQVIGMPEVLEVVTNPSFPHCSVYQFVEGEKSFIKKQTTFSVSVESLRPSQTFTLAETEKFRIEVRYETDLKLLVLAKKGDRLLGESPFRLRIWHKVNINPLQVETTKFELPSKEFQVKDCLIGSSQSPAGASFYVRGKFAPTDMTNVVFADYAGFAFHGPRIQAIPRILQAAITCDTAEKFIHYLGAIANLSRFVIVRAKYFLGIVRQLLRLKLKCMSNKLVVLAVTFVVGEDGIWDWEMFSDVCLDYDLWSNPAFVTTMAGNLENYFKQVAPDWKMLCRLSLFHFLVDLGIFLNGPTDIIKKLIIFIDDVVDDCSGILLHLLNKSPSPLIQSIIQESPKLLESVLLQYLGQLPENLALDRLALYVRMSCSSAFVVDLGVLDALFPVFETMIRSESLWLSLFVLLASLEMFDWQFIKGSAMGRFEVLPLILRLVLALFSHKETKPRFVYLMGLLTNMVRRHLVIKAVPSLEALQVLLHLNTTMDGLVLLPREYENSLLAGRKRLDQKPHTGYSPKVINHRYKFPVALAVLDSPDRNFSTRQPSFRSIVESMDAGYDKPCGERVLFAENPLAFPEHDLVVTFAVELLMRFEKSGLNQAHERLLFGGNVDPEASVQIHQLVVLRWLEVLPEIETLRFIQKMIILGWSEDKLNDLFAALCGRVQTAKKAITPPWWAEFGVTLKLIFVLAPNYKDIDLALHARIVFHADLCADRDYLLFALAIACSPRFNALPREETSQMRDIIQMTLSAVRTVDLTALMGCQFVQESDEKLEELARNTNVFSAVEEGLAPIMQAIVSQSNQVYADFVASWESRIPRFKEEVRCSRERFVVPYHIYTEVANQKCTDHILRAVEELSWKCRFNILARRNEQDMYTLWSCLPKDLPAQFQMGTSCHPLSVPTLLVPMTTGIPARCADVMRPGQNLPETIGAIPPEVVPGWVAQSFFPVKNVRGLFKDLFRQFGNFAREMQVALVFGSITVSAVLVIAENGILVLADALSDADIVLKEVPSDAESDLFHSRLLAGYYGPCSLFLAHAAMSFHFSDILATTVRSIGFEPIAVEVWLISGCSLLVVCATEEECAVVPQLRLVVAVSCDAVDRGPDS
jgi:hypothetical protein